jgi:hypothetical protein
MVTTMKSTTLIIVGLTVCFLSFDSSVLAQSGSRGGGGSSGAAASSGGRGAASGSSGNGIGGVLGGRSSRRLTPAQRQTRRVAEFLEQQRIQAEFLEFQSVERKNQFKQQLVQLGNNPNGRLNKQQSRLAIEEAKRDFVLLRKRKVAPAELTTLQPLFRLGEDSIDRGANTAMWPEALQLEDFAPIVSRLDEQIMDEQITDEESAKQFLNDLGKLNQSLNSAAAKGMLNARMYGEARHFITGLANEIHASDLIM